MVKSQNIKIYCGFANYVAIASNKVLQSFDAHNQSYINNFLPYLTPSLYCMGTRVSEPKKWLVPNFIFKGWEWCI